MSQEKNDILISSPRVSLIRPSLQLCDAFIAKANSSQQLHSPWLQPPVNKNEYTAYLNRLSKDAYEGFFILNNETNALLGVININEIVKGIFSSGYLGYYCFTGHEKQGFMKDGLLLVLDHAFNQLKLHRLEANIQPGNINSLLLVHRCGFIKEGYSKNYLKIDGKWQDHVRYAITKERFNILSKQKIANLQIRQLEKKDINQLSASCQDAGWNKPVEVFNHYYDEQINKQRLIWVATLDNKFAGYVTLLWKSLYQPFADKQIPEIKDLNVLPQFRNKGIGTALIYVAENNALKQSNQIGLGTGMYKDYGDAQKLYYSLGYVPDGRGLTSHYKPAVPGKSVIVDDDLCIWFVKSI